MADKNGAFVQVQVESAPRVEGCRVCGVVMGSHGRRNVRLIDSPRFGRPVQVVWRKRTWRCDEPDCPAGALTEQDEQVAAPRALLTARACRWAVGQLRRDPRLPRQRPQHRRADERLAGERRGHQRGQEVRLMALAVYLPYTPDSEA